MYCLYLFLLSQLNNDKYKYPNCDGHEITASKGLMKKKSTLFIECSCTIHNVCCRKDLANIYTNVVGVDCKFLYQETVCKTITYYGRFTMTLATTLF